jgi:hypothetical protein
LLKNENRQKNKAPTAERQILKLFVVLAFLSASFVTGLQWVINQGTDRQIKATQAIEAQK